MEPSIHRKNLKIGSFEQMKNIDCVQVEPQIVFELRCTIALMHHIGKLFCYGNAVWL